MDINFSETNFKFVIFSMNCESPESRRAWNMYHLFDRCGLPRPQSLIGRYDRRVEPAWITTTASLDALGTDWRYFLGDQESVLLVSSCNKQYAELLYLADGRREPLGSLTEVSSEEAQQEDAWTYNPWTNRWFVCRHANPDRTAPADQDAMVLWAAIDAALASEPYSGDRDIAMSNLRKVRDKMKPKWL